MNLEIKRQLINFYDKDVWEHLTVGEHLKMWSNTYADRVAVVDENEELTYRQLKDEVDCYANGLLNQGFCKGDKVLFQLPNSKEFIIILFAMMSIGVIPVIILMGHRYSEVKGILNKTNAKAYIGINRYLGFSYEDMVSNIIEDTKEDLQVYLIGETEKYEKLCTLRQNRKNKFVEELEYKETAIFLLSGGTTGFPKLIPNRHCEFIYLAKELANATDMNEDTVYLAALPMSHKFALCCPGMIGTLSKGGKVVTCRVSSPDEIIPLIEEHEVSIMALVPTLANMCIEYLKNDDADITSLKYIQIGGSVLDSNLAKKIQEEFNCKLLQLYGMSESLITCSRVLDDDYDRLHTQGKKLSEFDEARIVDENGKEVPDGDFGELIVRGPYTILEYYDSSKLNDTQFTEECFLRTGDRAAKLYGDNYKIVGRVLEMINRAGEKIVPSELENILLTNKNIREVQIVGIPDETLGEKIGVFILKGSTVLTLRDIRNYLLERGLASFKLPDEVQYVDQWPLTSVGKVDKSKLKQQMIK